ncbi:MAG: glycosyl hydrolase [Mariniphaga sp.]
MRIIKISRLLFLLLLFPTLLSGQQKEKPSAILEKGFLSPPESAKVWTWWHWMNGNVSKEGITADLEAMKRVGIGGLYNFHVGHQLPINGSVGFLSPQWWALSKFAAQEADRLNLKFGFNNCPGWSASGGPDVKVEQSMQKLVWSETKIAGSIKFNQLLARPKIDTIYNYYKDIVVLAIPDNGEGAINKNSIIDVSEKMDSEGRLVWDAPSGNWTIFRFGHTTTGKKNAPAPIGGEGLECDKMSKEAVAAFFKSYPAKYLANASEFKNGIKHIEIDSYEAGLQDWTPRFKEEFIKRRGYNPLVWLPVWANKTIVNKAISDRFRNDMKRTIAELFDENYFGYFADLVHQYKGLQLTIEPYDGPFNPYDVAARADILMGEYWQKPATWGWNWTADVVASAHVLEKNIVSAESLTGWPHVSKWQNDPFSLKSSADRAFCLGVNRMVLHTIAHQPWGDQFRPGMTMAFWGQHFGRTETWWEQSKVWFDYLSRCQYMLQQGEFVSDILCLNRGLSNLPDGFRADICSELQLINLVKAKNGIIVLPHGKTYRLLVVSDTLLTPEVARKVKALADAGIPIIGKKFIASPSLQNYPACDAEVRSISEQLQKKGVVMDLTINQLLDKKGILPDFITTEKEAAWVHRKTKEADIYFVSNQMDSTRILNCTFRVTGKQPEIWDAATGKIKNAGSFVIKDGLIQLPLKLDPSGSCFVIFRKPISSKNGTSPLNWPVYTPIQELTNPWTVRFDPKWGGPEQVKFPTLQDWSKNELKGIRYYSGTATYETTCELKEVPGSLFIDLGNVKNLAEVTLNGISLGVIWKPPFITNISKAAKLGKNILVVKVTNLWANRLIGDEQEPADMKWDTKLAGLGSVKNAMAGYKLMELPAWFIEGKQRPSSGRFTFTTFNYFTKDSPLLESGLIGPIKLLSED